MNVAELKMELLELRAKEGFNNQAELPPTFGFSKRWEAVNFLASPFKRSYASCFSELPALDRLRLRISICRYLEHCNFWKHLQVHLWKTGDTRSYVCAVIFADYSEASAGNAAADEGNFSA